MSLLEKKLLETSRINDAVYRKANYITKKYGGTVPLNLVRMNAVVEDDLLAFITRYFGIPSVTLKDLESIGMSVLNLVPIELAKRFRILPFEVGGNEVKAVLSDPTDDKIIDEIAFITGRRVHVHATLESVISWALLKYYGVITESGVDMPHATMPEVPMDVPDEEEIPIPLVTRKRRSAPPAAAGPVEEKEKPPAAPVKEESKEESEVTGEAGITEMGGWDAPFDLSRTSTTDIEPILTREELKEEKKRVKRRTPTKMAVPAPEAVLRVEKKDEKRERRKATAPAPGLIPLIEEKEKKKAAAPAPEAAPRIEKKEEAAKPPEPSRKEAPAVKEEAVPASERPTPKPAVKEKPPEPSRKEAPAAKEEAVPVSERPTPKPAAKPATIKEAVGAAAAPEEKARPAEKTRPERGSSVSISPVYIIGPTTAVAETIGKRETEPRPRKSFPPPGRSTFPPPAPTKGAPAKTIDRSRITRWATFLGTLSETDKVIDAALAFLDTAFGPTIFLRMKKQAASPYRFSLSVPKTMVDRLKQIAIEPPSFAPVWLSLEEGHFALTRVSVPSEYREIIEINLDAGWEDNPLVLIIPVIIGKTKIGVLLSVPTREWTETPELHDIFGVIESTLSKAFEKIIMERKKGLP